MSMAPPAARRKSDAAAERRRQLEEWKKKKEAQRKRQSIGGRTSLGGGAASSRPSISGVSDYSRRGSSGTVGSVAQGTPTSRLHAAREGAQQWDKDRRVGAKLAAKPAVGRACAPAREAGRAWLEMSARGNASRHLRHTLLERTKSTRITIEMLQNTQHIAETPLTGCS